ncbi:hypothetical protein FRB94_005425 [Tulasnella sp. JGI-2019a]|nr:hypothetical protein FRB94_005425 [Tulasnella sp. JGI-2019a]KAG9001952.1 hypothetical protein FRB93_011924 [Tulasnella sp. JGI-2019a]
MPATEIAGTRFSVKLNNLMQKKMVEYAVIEVSDGPRNKEIWTVTVNVISTAIPGAKAPFLCTGQGSTKGQAFNAASDSVLQKLGIQV